MSSSHTKEIHPVLLELFEEPSLRETVRRTVHGLRQPRASGEYKWARFRVKRLLCPLSAVVLPAFILLLISLLAAPPQQVERESVTRILPRPVPPPRLREKYEPVEPLRPELIVFPSVRIFGMPKLAPTSSIEPPSQTGRVPSPIPKLGVADTRSPVAVGGIYKDRGAAASGNAAGAGSGATAATEGAVLKSLRWLKSVQEDDGSWSLASGEDEGAHQGSGAAPAMTGLALLAYLAHGETPNSEEFGSTVKKALKWLLAAQEADGRFKGRDSHDYSHPIAAFALCEAYGMTRNPLLASVAARAIGVIIQGQNPHGGWTYNCKPTSRNDLSYTGWCVQAIKAAKLAGLSCEGLDDALARAVGGLCYNASPGGDFGYAGPAKSHLTGVGVSGLQLLGHKSPRHIARGLAALEAATCDWNEPLGRNPIYYWYYITQAKRLAGGKTWEAWNRQFSPEFTRHQTVLPGAGEGGKDIGYWESASDSEHCKSRVYNTTLCTLSLEVYYKVGGFDEPLPEKAKHEMESEDDVPLMIIDV